MTHTCRVCISYLRNFFSEMADPLQNLTFELLGKLAIFGTNVLPRANTLTAEKSKNLENSMRLAIDLMDEAISNSHKNDAQVSNKTALSASQKSPAMFVSLKTAFSSAKEKYYSLSSSSSSTYSKSPGGMKSFSPSTPSPSPLPPPPTRSLAKTSVKAKMMPKAQLTMKLRPTTVAKRKVKISSKGSLMANTGRPQSPSETNSSIYKSISSPEEKGTEPVPPFPQEKTLSKVKQQNTTFQPFPSPSSSSSGNGLLFYGSHHDDGDNMIIRW